MSKDKDDLRVLIQEYIFREGDNVSQRIDWSLIFHAILFEALFAIHDTDLTFSVPILILGLSVSWLWFLVGARQNWNINLLHGIFTKVKEGSEQLKRLERTLRDI